MPDLVLLGLDGIAKPGRFGLAPGARSAFDLLPIPQDQLEDLGGDDGLPPMLEDLLKKIRGEGGGGTFGNLPGGGTGGHPGGFGFGSGPSGGGAGIGGGGSTFKGAGGDLGDPGGHNRGGRAGGAPPPGGETALDSDGNPVVIVPAVGGPEQAPQQGLGGAGMPDLQQLLMLLLGGGGQGTSFRSALGGTFNRIPNPPGGQGGQGGQGGGGGGGGGFGGGGKGGQPH